MSLFRNGAQWLRADFHLHTSADKEFVYSGDENFYLSAYVDALANAHIRIGVVANHNKFHIQEFNGLRKTALKKDIFLLPGVELSVSDGTSGILTLIVFSDEWLDGGDFINQFLHVAFQGKAPTQYENNKARASLNLIDTIEKLESYHKDFFLILAHVEEENGFWHELDGGRITEFGKGESFKHRALGFQKVRTHDKPDKVCRVKMKGWLGDAYLAEVEGSDPKSIDQIGQGKHCYIKLGALTFDAVKFALLNDENRLKPDLAQISHSHICRIDFTGGIFDGKSISLSHELNTLIGIRGSGKSAIIEILRYALNLPFGENDNEKNYKNALVAYALGSGGKVGIDAIDRFGQPYRIERILNHEPEVFCNDTSVPGVSVCATVLNKPIYFGQKDLSSSADEFERDLIEKFIAEKLVGVRREIEMQKKVVHDIAIQYLKVGTVAERIVELEAEKLNIEQHLKAFAEHGVEEKMQKELDFDADLCFMEDGIRSVHTWITDVIVFTEEHSLPKPPKYVSRANPEMLNTFIDEYNKARNETLTTENIVSTIKSYANTMETTLEELREVKEGLIEEFAEIARKLADEFVGSNVRVTPDEFKKLTERNAKVDQELSLLTNTKERRNVAYQNLLIQLSALDSLWHKEFMIIKEALGEISSNRSALRVSCDYKGNKVAFLNFFKEMFRGSGIREATLQNITQKYADFVEFFKDLENVEKEKLLGSNPALFTEYVSRNLPDLLVYQTPNRFSIEYHGKELKRHSLGQRASALILFILSQKDNDLIIIDQPEDDLDNQTIYKDVLKLVRQLKPNRQFILATHNPNIPVLGDAEQILACTFSDNKVNIQTGSIDVPKQQQTIVNIMEGGPEAFKKRKEIYQSWNS
jgi:predicted ATPase